MLASTTTGPLKFYPLSEMFTVVWVVKSELSHHLQSTCRALAHLPRPVNWRPFLPWEMLCRLKLSNTPGTDLSITAKTQTEEHNRDLLQKLPHGVNRLRVLLSLWLHQTGHNSTLVDFEILPDHVTLFVTDFGGEHAHKYPIGALEGVSEESLVVWF